MCYPYRPEGHASSPVRRKWPTAAQPSASGVLTMMAWPLASRMRTRGGRSLTPQPDRQDRMQFRILVLTLLLIAAIAPAADASSRQLALFQEDGPIVNGDPAQRAAALDELQALGVDAIKIQLNWSEVAPRTRRKPAGFDGRDPAGYPGWGKFDAAVSAAQERGFRVMLALSPPVPGWATKRRGDREGVDRPSSKEFGRFAEAAGKRYASVDLWTLWNEPNHPGFLYPQATRERAPYSPQLYRALLRAAVAGL